MPSDTKLDKKSLNQQRRPELACDDDWIRNFLIRVEVGHVATCWETQPFITPVLFWYDVQSHDIYFHSSTVGRLRENVKHYPEVCFEACEIGRLLPSNLACKFSLQYESVIAFGEIRVLNDEQERMRALYGLIEKYFPKMELGIDYCPISEDELNRTLVYAIAIQSWSGKRNWKEQAAQNSTWKPRSNP